MFEAQTQNSQHSMLLIILPSTPVHKVICSDPNALLAANSIAYYQMGPIPGDTVFFVCFAPEADSCQHTFGLESEYLAKSLL